jgi:phosphohistidine phosphatase
MRKILIIRHATAEHEGYFLKDFDRNLDQTGIAEAKKLGKFIQTKKIKPGIVYCSSASRTLQTANIFLQESGLESIQLEPVPALYNSNYQTLLLQIQASPPEIDCICIVAHNPGVSQIATMLCQSEHFQLAPGSAVCLEFDTDKWQKVSGGSGKENWYFVP